jgi:hypothetical protein
VCSSWKGTGSPRCGSDRHPLSSVVSAVRRLTVPRRVHYIDWTERDPAWWLDDLLRNTRSKFFCHHLLRKLVRPSSERVHADRIGKEVSLQAGLCERAQKSATVT